MASYNAFVRAQSIVSDIFSSARSYKSTHDELLKMRDARLFSLPGYTGSKRQKFTRYEVGYLRGQWETLSDTLWHSLVWAFDCSPGCDGSTEPVLYREATEEQKANFIHPNTEARGHHYWAGSDGRPSNKRFY